jgi:hypothetical protein
MPWEFSRARRLCAVITKNQLSLWESATAAMRQQKPIAGCFPDYPTFQKSAEWSWWETTPLARLSELNRWARGEGEFESQRRAMQLLLDLHIHRVRAGKLPESLDELAAETPGPLPADAVSGRPLLYFPGGSPSGWREMNEWLERVEEYRDAGRSGSVSHEWRGRVHAEAYFFEAAARPVLWGESTGWIAVGGGK